MENFDFISLVPCDNYFVVTDGNCLRSYGPNMKPMRRRCFGFSRKGLYTELWYKYSNGNVHLCNFWN